MKIIQKKKPYTASFDFGADQLEYSFNQFSTVHGGSTPYQNIPGLWRIQQKKLWREKYFALSFVLFGLVVMADGIEDMLLHVRADKQSKVIAMLAVVFVIFICIPALGYMRNRIRRPPSLTVIKCKPDICIIDDKDHDIVASEIRKRRVAALRQKLAFNDPLGTVQAEARKFSWLKESDIITEQEYATFMAQLTTTQENVPPPVEEKRTLH